jgi:hypothetical protein
MYHLRLQRNNLRAWNNPGSLLSGRTIREFYMYATSGWKICALRAHGTPAIGGGSPLFGWLGGGAVSGDILGWDTTAKGSTGRTPP